MKLYCTLPSIYRHTTDTAHERASRMITGKSEQHTCHEVGGEMRGARKHCSPSMRR